MQSLAPFRMMNAIDWLRAACDPAAVLAIGCETSPYEFFIGLGVWRAGHLLPWALPFPARPPSLPARPASSLSQDWWCHSAGPRYWIRVISFTAWFSGSNPISPGTAGLRVVMCFFVWRWHHRITSRCSKLKSFPINCVPHDTKTMCHSALAFSNIFQEKGCFQQLK